MYGELNYKEWQLWGTTWNTIVLSLRGLRDKDYLHESIMRRVAAAVVGAGNNKSLANRFATFWPESRKKKRKVNSAALEQLRRFKTLEAQKNAGRT